jgi:hypothetical protein
MILAFPAVCDALFSRLTTALGSSSVFDGPPARIPGSSGLALGTTREDVSSDFTADPAGLSGVTAEGFSVTCLAWAGGGGVTFKPFRDRVRDIVAATADAIASDPTLSGAVDTAEVTGGTWLQEQTGEGALVTCEFRINVRKF